MTIYDYLNFRTFLNDKFKEIKAEKRYFTQAHFARIAGLGSNSYLRMVIQGTRNLKVDTIRRFSKALQLNKNESAYFEALVLFNQAKTDAEQDDYFNQLAKLRPKKEFSELNKDQFEYFTKRHFVTIREMSALPHFQDKPEWICVHLQTPITLDEAKHALAVLERLGLLVKNNEGKLVHSNTTLTTQPYIESMEIYQYNRGLLNEAKTALTMLPSRQTDIASVTIPLPTKAFDGVSQILQKCREEIAHYVSNFGGGYDEIYQINMQAYPLTKTRENLQNGIEGEAKKENNI